MSEIRAVVFDWAGTVIDFGSRAPMGVFVEAFARFGVAVTVAEARGPMGRPKGDHIAAMLGEPRIAAAWTAAQGTPADDEAADRIYEVFVPMNEAVVGDFADLVPGAAETVAALVRAAGLDMVPPAANSFCGLELAYEYTNVPMFVLFSLPAMALIREEWWEAAQVSSASRFQFWRYVGWPVLRPFLLASWLLIFTWSVGMYGTPVALMGESPAAYPLITIDMSRTLQGSLFGSRRMPVMAVILMIFAILSLLLFRLFTRRGLKWLT